MNTVNSFEDLPIWQKAMDLALRVYRLAEEDRSLRNDPALKDQLRKAAHSISDQIAEGFEYQNQAAFYQFLRRARGSCGLLRNSILFLQHRGGMANDLAQLVLNDAAGLSCEIGAVMETLPGPVKAVTNGQEYT